MGGAGGGVSKTEYKTADMQAIALHVINEDLTCIYMLLVKPDKPVLDYLTRFSGVDEEMLRDVSVRLSDVQSRLVRLLPSNAILIDHF